MTACSFVKHWDNRNGERCQECKNVGDQSIGTKSGECYFGDDGFYC